MHRFFLSPNCIENNRVTFPADISHQLDHVLRMRTGVTVTVLDGLGNQYGVELLEIDPQHAIGQVISKGAANTEPKTHLTLLLCLTQREKFEWILQKCTELGVASIIPVISSRSLVQSERDVEGKLERWQRILREAAEQSHRGAVPKLEQPLRLSDAIRLAEIKNDLRLIPWEEEKTLGIREALRKNNSQSISLLIGPEGGFTENEVALAISAGFIPVSLGPRILRMETAAVAAAAALFYERGDMNIGLDQASG